LKQNIFEVTFLIIFSVLFVYTKYVGFLIDSQRLKNLSKYIIIIRNVFIFIKVFGRVKKFNTLINRIASHPALRLFNSKCRMQSHISYISKKMNFLNKIQREA